jgi:hypothetical protein
MAQIIKHRRGTGAELAAATLRKGELGVTTGSIANLTAPIVHVGNDSQLGGYAVGRLLRGTSVPDVSSLGSTYDSLVYHDTDNFTLYRLNGSGANENINFINNLANRAVTGSLTLSSKLRVEGAPNVTSISASGEITASNILATGNIHAVGDITFDGGSGGTITLGSGADDDIVLAGDVNSNIIPNTDDTFDLGSSGQQWKDLYLDGVAYIDVIGSDGDPTTTAYIAGGEIDGTVIGSETPAAGTFTSVTVSGVSDLNGNVDIDNTTTAVDSSGGISLDAGAASNFTTTAGALTLDGAGGINIGTAGNVAVDFNAAAFDLDAAGALTIDSATSIAIGTNANKPIDIDATTFDLDAAGALTLDSATSISIGTNADKPIDIDATTFDLDATSTISLDSSAGSIDMNVADGQTVSIGLNAAVETIWSPHNTAGSELWSTINTAGTTDGTDGAGAILLSSVAGGIGLAWADTKDLWAEGGRFVVTANEDAAGAIKLHADAGTSQTITIVNDAGTAGNAVDIDATAGGIDIDAGLILALDGAGGINIGTAANVAVDFNASTFDLDASGALTLDSATSISIGTNANKPIDIDATTFDLDAAGALTLDSATSISIGTNADKPIDIDATTFDLDAAGALTIDSATSITIGATADKPIDIDSTTLDIDASGAITIDGTSTIGIGTSAAAGNITIGSNATARTVSIGNATGASILDLNSGTGGVDVDTTGNIALDTTSNNASAVTITTNSGATEQIVITNTQGTNAAAIDINASAGGVTIDAASGISLDAAAASNLTTSGGAITIDGKTGVTISENGGAVIAIDTAKDVLFSHTGGATGDPDVEIDGYTRFDGLVEIANTTAASSTSTGALVVDGGVGVAEDIYVGGQVDIAGNLTVAGTTTTVSSTEVNIGDNIIVLNTAGAAKDGGIHVLDVVGTKHTGSMLWNPTSDYWYSGVSGSTFYRVPQQTTATALTNNKVLIADASGRVEPSANITDDGSTIDINDVNITSIAKLEGVDANTFVNIGVTDTVTTKGNIVPNATNADDLGTNTKRFKDLYLEGNADVDGTLNIEGVVTTQALIAATAGITVTNTAATVSSDLILNYSTNAVHRLMFQNGSNDSVDFLPAPASTSTNGDTSGEYARWTGTAFEMSQTIDGGSF